MKDLNVELIINEMILEIKETEKLLEMRNIFQNLEDTKESKNRN